MPELRTRIEAKKKQLEAELLTLKADTEAKTSEAARRVKSKLGKLEEILEQKWDDVSGRWDELSEGVRAKLSEWLR